MREFDLEKFVERNRFTIAVIFPLVGAIGFIASAENLVPGFLAFSPFMILFGTLVMRLPLIAGLRPLIDRRAGFGILLLSLYAYFIEFVGLKTGWPYGSFEYLVELGPMIQGVPVGLPVFFIPLVVNSYLLVNLFDVESFFKRIFLTLVVILLIDLVLDPAAVSLGIWQYSEGFFYGVPLSNFAGWVISGAVAVLVMEYSLNLEELKKRLSEKDYMLDDMVSFVFLWGIINLYYLNIVPVIVALGLGMALHRTGRFNFAFEELGE